MGDARSTRGRNSSKDFVFFFIGKTNHPDLAIQIPLKNTGANQSFPLFGRPKGRAPETPWQNALGRNKPEQWIHRSLGNERSISF
jgi:hypothetical protein